MSAALVRVINLQVLPRSILLDKIDRTSGQFETDITYAQLGKQAVYVPQVNPLDPTVDGYIDLVPTDEVLLQVNEPHGVIVKLAAKGYVSYFAHSGTLTVAPVITTAVHAAAHTAETHGQYSAAVGNVAVFTDATANAFTPADAGSPITISASSHSVNNGTFEVVTYNAASNVSVISSAALADGAATDDWSTPGGIQINGTTLLSLTPDHTYVKITHSGSTQTVTDTAIIAAGGTVSSTLIFVPNTVITIGTPGSGWTVQVQANSKLSGSATTT